MLDIESIMKRLHINTFSGALSMDELCCENLSTSIRDLSFYPEPVYEEYRVKFQEVASRFGYVVPNLNKSYNQWVAEWVQQYRPQPEDLSSLSSEVTTISS
jgi:hypothetical protein